VGQYGSLGPNKRNPSYVVYIWTNTEKSPLDIHLTSLGSESTFAPWKTHLVGEAEARGSSWKILSLKCWWPHTGDLSIVDSFLSKRSNARGAVDSAKSTRLLLARTVANASHLVTLNKVYICILLVKSLFIVRMCTITKTGCIKIFLCRGCVWFLYSLARVRSTGSMSLLQYLDSFDQIRVLDIILWADWMCMERIYMC
jgi:hypothetical protein